MTGLRLTLAGAILAAAVAATSGDAGAAPRKGCEELGRDPAQGVDCISPTFPTARRGVCATAACYRASHKRKKTKS